MKTKHLIAQLDHDAIVAAIREAESKTSGELRVFISPRKTRDAQRAAMRQFERLGMHKTRQRNGVLIFVAPESRNFAVIGDEAVHAKCGDAFWQKIVAEMAGRFRSGEFTQGIVHGIAAAGKILAEHFPRSRHDIDELPDTIAGKS